MAKSNRNIRGESSGLEKQYEQLDAQASMWRKINEAKEKGIAYDEKLLKDLEKQHISYKSLEKRLDDILRGWDKVNDEVDSSNKKIKDTLEDYDDLEDTLTSIGSKLGKQSGEYTAINKKLEGTKAFVGSISNILQKQSDLSEKQVDQITSATKGYTNLQTSIARAQSLQQKGKITQSEFNKLIKDSYDNFDSLIDSIDDSTESGARLKERLKEARAEAETFAKAAEKSASNLEMVNTALDELGSSGIPAASQLSTVFQKMANKDIPGVKLALTALGAALGKLAYDYFGAPLQAGIKASNDIKENQIEGAKNVAQAQNDLKFAGMKAAQDFGFELRQMAAQFKAASKTAFFGNQLGSVGYAADKLMLAGISAETIASATTAASKAGSGSTKLAADMAIFAERSGISVDNVADIQKVFKLLDKVSAKTALNMTQGTRAMAEQAGLNVGDVMQEVASASQIALEAHVQSGKALARQVIYAKSLGVSFNDVAKAGSNMVLNYKDSIKAEMSLSAMLGKNVDLSEVRAKFMAGDTEGALSSLKAKGLKPSEMNMFQKQALQQALGGLDLNSLEAISTPGYQEDVKKLGTGDNLAASNAKSANEAFLSLKKAAEGGLRSDSAYITAEQAVVDAALQTKITEEWLKSPAYTNYLAEIQKMGVQRSITENIGGAVSAAVGGIAGNMLGGKLGAKAGGTVAKTGAKVGAKTTAKTGAKSLGKSLLKKLPFVGLGMGLLLAAEKAIAGDFSGAALEAASGGASMIPGIGTGASVGIDALIAAKDMGAFNKTETKVKPIVNSTNGANQTQLQSQKIESDNAKRTLTESQYGIKLQQEMVAVLGMSAQFLQQISDNTTNEKGININGKVLSTTLLNQARRNYGVARTA